MATKRSGWQQTGFRADRDLLTRFRSKLAAENRSMGPVIEDFITKYVEGKRRSVIDGQRRRAVAFANTTEAEVCNSVLGILRGGGEAADHLQRTILLLSRMVKPEPPL